MGDSFFTTDDGELFRPTQHTRGPWDPNACHAGPPTGLIARAAERAVPDKRLARLNVDLLRPIPFAGFRVVLKVTRSGRAVASTSATLADETGRACATAISLHVATPGGGGEFPDGFEPPVLADAKPGAFPITRLLHGLPGFSGDGVAVRYPRGEHPEPGPTMLWMSTVPLLPDEEPSPFQRICPLADCGNAISRWVDPSEMGFVNADLTIMLHRNPRGEWLGSRATSSWHDDGTALADALLFDEHGSVGRALQTVLLTPPPTPR
ncbi:MAG: thioesterase family protein [Actinomycetota bacterium]|nr:thioesterase family protein [Actinomycetota bacterium]